MANEIIKDPPPRNLRVIELVRLLKRGQTLKTDQVQLNSAKSIGGKVAAEFRAKGEVRKFIAFEADPDDGFRYIQRADK